LQAWLQQTPSMQKLGVAHCPLAVQALPIGLGALVQTPLPSQ
jgi:hypothetical protein